MIKEYADRIREEIKKTDCEMESLVGCGFCDPMLIAGLISGFASYKDGLNKALDIYLELVKEDL